MDVRYPLAALQSQHLGQNLRERLPQDERGFLRLNEPGCQRVTRLLVCGCLSTA